MAHGGPDWGELAPKATVYTTIDLAEHAARVGSIVTFDRRGDVVWLDDFESGIQRWHQIADGTGAAVEWSAKTAKSGAFSCKLTTGDDDGDRTSITSSIPLPVLSKVGFEFSFTMEEDLSLLNIPVNIHDGSLLHQPYMFYDVAAKTLNYLDSAFLPQVLASDLALYTDIRMFHTLKLVIDLVNKKYVRCILNEKEYPMVDIGYYTFAFAATPYMSSMIEIETGVAANRFIYIDDVIITQNEP